MEYNIFNVGSEEKIEIENLAKIFKDLFDIDFMRVNGKSEINDIYLPNVDKAKKMHNLDYKKNLKKLVLDNFNNLKIEYPEIIGYKHSASHTKVAAGWLIDKAGWKGYKEKNVGVYKKQALVLVNHGGANGQEILDGQTNVIIS